MSFGWLGFEGLGLGSELKEGALGAVLLGFDLVTGIHSALSANAMLRSSCIKSRCGCGCGLKG